MFSDEIKTLLFQVIKSWQVLAVTGVLILYVFLVNSVAKLYHRPKRPVMSKSKSKADKKAGEAHAVTPTDSDDLGLEDDHKDHASAGAPPGKKP